MEQTDQASLFYLTSATLPPAGQPFFMSSQQRTLPGGPPGATMNSAGFPNRHALASARDLVHVQFPPFMSSSNDDFAANPQPIGLVSRFADMAEPLDYSMKSRADSDILSEFGVDSGVIKDISHTVTNSSSRRNISNREDATDDTNFGVDSGVIKDISHTVTNNSSRRKISNSEDATEDTYPSGATTKSLDSGFVDSLPWKSYRTYQPNQLPPKKRRLLIEQDLSVPPSPTESPATVNASKYRTSTPNIPLTVPKVETSTSTPNIPLTVPKGEPTSSTSNFPQDLRSFAVSDPGTPHGPMFHYGHTAFPNTSSIPLPSNPNSCRSSMDQDPNNIQDLQKRLEDTRITRCQSPYNANQMTVNSRTRTTLGQSPPFLKCPAEQYGLDNMERYYGARRGETTMDTSDNAGLLSVERNVSRTTESGVESMDYSRAAESNIFPRQEETFHVRPRKDTPSHTPPPPPADYKHRPDTDNKSGTRETKREEGKNTSDRKGHDVTQEYARLENGLLSEEQEELLCPDDDGDLSLHIAVVQSQPRVIDKLLSIMKTADVCLDYHNNLKQTPLHLAVITKQPDIIEQLLRAGCLPAVQDRKGNTSFHLAVNHKTPECLAVLLQHGDAGADLNAKNFEGLTPMHRAVQTGCEKCMTLLIQYGTNINMVDGKSGKSALYLAFECNQPHIADLLLSRGADVNVPTYSGSTVLQAANTKGQHLLNHLMNKDRPGLDSAQLRSLTKNKKNSNTILTHSSRGSSKLSTNMKPGPRDHLKPSPRITNRPNIKSPPLPTHPTNPQESSIGMYNDSGFGTGSFLTDSACDVQHHIPVTAFTSA